MCYLSEVTQPVCHIARLDTSEPCHSAALPSLGSETVFHQSSNLPRLGLPASAPVYRPELFFTGSWAADGGWPPEWYPLLPVSQCGRRAHGLGPRLCFLTSLRAQRAPVLGLWLAHSWPEVSTPEGPAGEAGGTLWARSLRAGSTAHLTPQAALARCCCDRLARAY